MTIRVYSIGGRLVRPTLPSQRPEADHQLLAVASQVAYTDGERIGYIQGTRDGRVAGLCWGLLLGAIAAAAYLTLWGTA